ncbi:MAG: leucine-rich repeat protein [Clostridia bacterium]|nr:leucine-rich repeat protein [Clostridia bacterium]
MKKTLKVVLVLVITLTFVAMFSIASIAESYDNFAYEVLNDEIMITSFDRMSRTVKIPSEINGYPVTSIDNNALLDLPKLAQINVDNNNEYYCDIEGVLFSKDKTELIKYPIGNIQTSYCVPDSVTSIAYGAFYNSNLTSIVISDNVRSIGDWAFQNCKSLTEIIFPNSVTDIGEGAFYDCYKIDSISIPGSITSIGNMAFYNCHLASITFSEGVTNIGNGAFYNCDCETVVLPDGVKNIGVWAFYDCDKMTSIFIPDSVINIGTDAFGYCDNLTIYGYEESTAETYASENDIPFVVREIETFAEVSKSTEPDESAETHSNNTQENKQNVNTQLLFLIVIIVLAVIIITLLVVLIVVVKKKLKK